MFVTVTGFFLTPFFPLLNIFSPKSMYMMIWRVRNITLSAAQHREDFYHSFLEPAGLVILSSRNYLCTTSSMTVSALEPLTLDLAAVLTDSSSDSWKLKTSQYSLQDLLTWKKQILKQDRTHFREGSWSHLFFLNRDKQGQPSSKLLRKNEMREQMRRSVKPNRNIFYLKQTGRWFEEFYLILLTFSPEILPSLKDSVLVPP